MPRYRFSCSGQQPALLKAFARDLNRGCGDPPKQLRRRSATRPEPLAFGES